MYLRIHDKYSSISFKQRVWQREDSFTELIFLSGSMAQWSESCLLTGGSNGAGSNLHVDVFFSVLLFLIVFFPFCLFPFILPHCWPILATQSFLKYRISSFRLRGGKCDYVRFFCILECQVLPKVLRVFLSFLFGFQRLSFSEFKSTTYQIEGRNN